MTASTTGMGCRFHMSASHRALAFAMILLGAPAAVHAQQAAAPAAALDAPGEIVVTATKRALPIQKVPASISAVTGEQLTQQRITQPGDLGNLVPNLTTTAAAGEEEPNYSLRGVSLNDATASSQGPIAIYYDEVYKGSHPLQGINMFDLERVEVLRGPQGTLYGKNASGGAINFISKVPGFKTEGYLNVGFGNYGRREASGAIQTGLTSTLAVRAAFTYAKADGWVDNVYPGAPNPSGTDYYGVRLSALWKPTDRLSFILRLSGSRSNGTNYTLFPTPTDPATVPGTCFGFGVGIGCGVGGASYFPTGLKKFQVDSNYVPRYYHKSQAVSLTTNYDLTEDLKLISISSFDHGVLKAPEDGDGSPYQVFEVSKTNARTNQVAEDLRLTSDFAGRFNFILGGYYNRERTFNDTAYEEKAVYGSDCDLSLFAGCLAEATSYLTRKTLAVYSDASFKITDKLSLIGGLRYTNDKGELTHYTGGYYNLGDRAPVFIPIDDLSAGYKTNKITGRAGLDFQVTRDLKLYATYSTGFRGAGFNVASTDDPSQIVPSKPETVTSIEGGVKSQWFDRHLTVNAAIYDYQYKNQQSQDIINGIAILRALPKSEIYGGELEFTARPLSTVRLNGGLGYTHARIKKGVFQGIDVSGNVVPLTSKITANYGVEWDFIKSDDATVTVGVNGSYTSKQYYDIYNTEYITQGGYTLLNGNLRFERAGGKYAVSLWARNIFNKFYYNYRVDTSFFGGTTGTAGQARTYGGTFEVKF